MTDSRHKIPGVSAKRKRLVWGDGQKGRDLQEDLCDFSKVENSKRLTGAMSNGSG